MILEDNDSFASGAYTSRTRIIQAWLRYCIAIRIAPLHVEMRLGNNLLDTPLPDELQIGLTTLGIKSTPPNSRSGTYIHRP